MKISKYIGFCVYRRSYLLRFPVILIRRVLARSNRAHITQFCETQQTILDAKLE